MLEKIATQCNGNLWYQKIGVLKNCLLRKGHTFLATWTKPLNCQIYIRVNKALLKQSVTLLAMKLNVKHNIRKQEKNNQMKAYYSYVATQ